MDRAEHLQWCKDRALEYVNAGQLDQALTSILSDLGKHPETEGSLKSRAPLGMMMLITGELSTKHEMAKFINGFN